jgi:hypothetical protein
MLFTPIPGFTVLLAFTPEHARLVRPAIRLARLFVRHIVDRLAVVLVVPEAESRVRAAAQSVFALIPRPTAPQKKLPPRVGRHRTSVIPRPT